MRYLQYVLAVLAGSTVAVCFAAGVARVIFEAMVR